MNKPLKQCTSKTQAKYIKEYIAEYWPNWRYLWKDTHVIYLPRFGCPSKSRLDWKDSVTVEPSELGDWNNPIRDRIEALGYICDYGLRRTMELMREDLEFVSLRLKWIEDANVNPKGPNQRCTDLAKELVWRLRSVEDRGDMIAKRFEPKPVGSQQVAIATEGDTQ